MLTSCWVNNNIGKPWQGIPITQERRNDVMGLLRLGLNSSQVARIQSMDRKTVRKVWQERAVFNRPKGGL